MSIVLVVDDDRSTRFVLRMILERAGRDAVELAAGIQAIASRFEELGPAA